MDTKKLTLQFIINLQNSVEIIDIKKPTPVALTLHSLHLHLFTLHSLLDYCVDDDKIRVKVRERYVTLL